MDLTSGIRDDRDKARKEVSSGWRGVPGPEDREQAACVTPRGLSRGQCFVTIFIKASSVDPGEV